MSWQVNQNVAAFDSGLTTTPLQICHCICTTEPSPRTFVEWFGVVRPCEGGRTGKLVFEKLESRSELQTIHDLLGIRVFLFELHCTAPRTYTPVPREYRTVIKEYPPSTRDATCHTR